MWVPDDRHLYKLLTDWGGFIGGIFALGAAWWAVRATRSTAKDQIEAAGKQADKQIAAAQEQADIQIKAARAEADKVIVATREQTSVTAEQTATTVRLERERIASEASAFRAMLAAAMASVIAEADWAREKYPNVFTQKTSDPSADAYAVRKCISKGAFGELCAACIRQTSPLTVEFLDLEREIDSFASQVGTYAGIPKGTPEGLGDQLDSIKGSATALGEKALLI